jgi:CRISPR-associated protein Csx10
MSIRLEFEIEFGSDFHVGAGHGLGLEVDSALLRDPDRVPVIRGTVLTGLLRESLTNLLSLKPLRKEKRCQASGAINGPAYCGQFAPGDPDCPACAILGSPRRSKRWRISSARPAGLFEPQDPLRTEWRAGETAARMATRARVNPRTRRAEENKLFTREEGNGSMHFRFTAECLSDDESAWREAEWLVAAARLVRNLGASKRRGRGECEIHLIDREQEKTLLGRFDDHLNGRQPRMPAGQARGAVQRLALAADPGQHTYRLRVLLRADEPLLVARRAEAGNQFETLESIPGSVLRGALAWRVARRAAKKLGDDDSDEYKNFVDLFFRDAIRFSPLLPVEVSYSDRHHGHPTIPAPRDLLTCELHPGYESDINDRGHGVWSKTWDDDVPDQCGQCAQPDDARGTVGTKVKLRPIGGFLPLNRAGLTTRFRSRQTVEMHIRIHPRTGRVRAGDLFGYVSLEPGQYFVGEITCTDRSIWQILRQVADLKPVGQVNELRLGRACRRGHGKASVLLQEADKSPWQGPSLAERVTDANKVVLTLLSDAIVTDPWGRFVRGFDATWLERELALPDQVVVTVDPARCFSGVRPVDAFNAKLGLPRTRDVALVAGSSVRLSFSGVGLGELQASLARVEAQGIGLRRDEGFGRVAFNHLIYQELDDWDEPALDLSTIVLGQEAGEHDCTRLAVFEREWAKKLDDALKPEVFAYGQFEATARLLHVSQARSSEAAEQELQKMGEQDQLLPKRLVGRDKKNFYREGDGRPGMEKVYNLLGELGTLINEQDVAPEMAWQLWKTGLQMLADRIAGPARQKAREKR